MEWSQKLPNFFYKRHIFNFLIYFSFKKPALWLVSVKLLIQIISSFILHENRSFIRACAKNIQARYLYRHIQVTHKILVYLGLAKIKSNPRRQYCQLSEEPD